MLKQSNPIKVISIIVYLTTFLLMKVITVKCDDIDEFTQMNAKYNPLDYPCNPASWCHDQSLLCKSSQEVSAIIAGQDPSSVIEHRGRGICTDAYRWQCNSSGHGCKKHLYPIDQAWARCKGILVPGKNVDIYAGKFVEACRAGEYTCNNGICTLDPADCFKSAAGGIRYSNYRCPKDTCGGDNLLKEICKTESIPSDAAMECVEEPQSNVPPCCPTPIERQCRHLELAGSGEENLRQCGGECPDESICTTESNDSDDPDPVDGSGATTTKYPPSGIALSFKQDEESKYCCCRISCDCFGDPHCTNFFGEQQTSKVSSGSYTMFKNSEIGIEAFLGVPQGIIRKVLIITRADSRIFELNTEQCNNATHNWMDASTGEFIDLSSIPSNWDTTYSPSPDGPAGFTHPSLYKVRDRTAQILIEIKCQPFLWQYSEGTVLAKYRRSTRIDIVVTAWREKKVDEATGEVCCPGEQENLDWFVATGAEGYCVDSTATPLPGAQVNRRQLSQDLSIIKIAKPQSQRTPMIHQSTRMLNKNFWIGFSQEKTRRLIESHDPEFERVDADSRGRSLSTAEELCDEYLQISKDAQSAIFTDLEQCLETIGDFGIGSIETLIELLKTSTKECIDSLYDPRLPGADGLRDCEEGIVLEVRLTVEDEWRPIQSFPANLPYCNNKIEFFFEGVQILPGRFLNSTDSFRLTQCTPDPAICGICTPLRSIEDYGYSYVYQCKSFTAMKNFLKLDFLESMKTGKISCGFKYLGSIDPLACARSSLRTFFN